MNKEAFPLVHDFYVEKDEMIPTHSCVGIVLSRNASTEPRRFARTLPCLKKLFDQKLQDLMAAAGSMAEAITGKGKQGDGQREKNNLKQQAAMKKEERKKLQGRMDQVIEGRRHTPKAYEQMEDVDGMWKMISSCVEKHD